MVIVSLAPLLAGAQTLAPNPNEGVPIGPFLFTPAVELTWEHRDNIFFAPDDPTADTVYLARTRLQLELPIYDSYLRFSYMPQYRDYLDYDLRRKWQHFAAVEGAFAFANGLELTTGYHFVSGNLETRQVDPGGELAFGDRQFDKHQVDVEGDYWITPRDGFSVQGSWTDVAYQREAAVQFYDYSRSAFGLSWLHLLRPTLQMNLSYRHNVFDARDTVAYRSSVGDELTLGAIGQLTPVVRSELRVGWRLTALDRTASNEPPAEPDFRGLITSGSLSWEMGHGGVLTLDLLRSDYPSNYAQNAYYTATGGGLTYELQRGRIFGDLRYHRQTNDYNLPDPELGSTRSDEITTWGGGLGVRLNLFTSVRASYTHQVRDTLHPYSYTANIFTVGLVLGY